MFSPLDQEIVQMLLLSVLEAMLQMPLLKNKTKLNLVQCIQWFIGTTAQWSITHYFM